jgi:hypothetical protein
MISRNKHELFRTKWAEQAAWSNVTLRQTAVQQQRNQELLLLRKAHITVSLFVSSRENIDHCIDK